MARRFASLSSFSLALTTQKKSAVGTLCRGGNFVEVPSRINSLCPETRQLMLVCRFDGSLLDDLGIFRINFQGPHSSQGPVSESSLFHVFPNVHRCRGSGEACKHTRTRSERWALGRDR